MRKCANRPLRGLLLAGAALGALASVRAEAAGVACSVGALSGLNVPGVTVASATSVAASGSNPAYCDVIGTLNTSGEGAPDGSAGFELRLPATWNGKFLFLGVGGYAGATYADAAANAVDALAALPKGYAVAITDEGHLGVNTDASWALDDAGTPDAPKLADYFYRATHQVTLAGKALVQGYYGGAISRAYFDGCSNGGRQAMVEASRYPDDYDGIIAGAPFFDIRTLINGDKNAKQLLTNADTYIPASLLPVVDQAVYASCDAADGVADGLIQNPAKCSFDPATLICQPGQTANCLTVRQADGLRVYFSKTTDEQGNFVYTGFSVTDLAGGGMDAWTTGFTPPSDFASPEPWANDGFSPAPYGYQFVDHGLKFFYAQDPTYPFRSFPVTRGGKVSDAALAQFDAATSAGSARDAASYQPYIASGRKLLIYHGYSDPALPPFRTIRLYRQMEQLAGSWTALQQNVRLFMVPGMQHCGGGPGPNVFDTLSPLEAWVENGTAPASIVAAHFQNNNPQNPVTRTMPLCPFPTEASYAGSGDVNSAANWSCAPNNKLLEVGLNGRQAGYNAP